MPPTYYYVRATNGADVAGQGTTHATAYKTPQFALNDIGATHGRDAVLGDQINICDTAVEGANVLAASLTLATYGVPAMGAPLILRGYTAVANDGGRGEIDCGGFTMWNVATYDYVNCIDLELHTFGDNYGIVLDQGFALINCEIHRGASIPANKFLVFSNQGLIAGCYVHDAGALPSSSGQGIYAGSGIIYCFNNFIENCLSSLYANNHWVILGNIIYANAAGATGLTANGNNILCSGNIVYNAAAGTGFGISAPGGFRYSGEYYNNIVAGFSGAGGRGMEVGGKATMMGYNAFYNNTTNVNVAGEIWNDQRAHDVALAADPFTNAAGGDFSLTAAAQALLRSEGWPESYLGAATDPHITIGVVQYGDVPVPCDYPLPGAVEAGIVYGSGALTGTLVCPSGGGARPGCRWPDYKRRFDI